MDTTAKKLYVDFLICHTTFFILPICEELNMNFQFLMQVSGSLSPIRTKTLLYYCHNVCLLI